MRPHLEQCVRFWGPYSEEDVQGLERGLENRAGEEEKGKGG